MNRFTTVTLYNNVDADMVVDTDAFHYKMPERAVSMNLRHEAATKIATILNEEWLAFLANPT